MINHGCCDGMEWLFLPVIIATPRSLPISVVGPNYELGSVSCHHSIHSILHAQEPNSSSITRPCHTPSGTTTTMDEDGHEQDDCDWMRHMHAALLDPNLGNASSSLSSSSSLVSNSRIQMLTTNFRVQPTVHLDRPAEGRIAQLLLCCWGGHLLPYPLYRYSL